MTPTRYIHLGEFVELWIYTEVDSMQSRPRTESSVWIGVKKKKVRKHLRHFTIIYNIKILKDLEFVESTQMAQASNWTSHKKSNKLFLDLELQTSMKISRGIQVFDP